MIHSEIIDLLVEKTDARKLVWVRFSDSVVEGITETDIIRCYGETPESDFDPAHSACIGIVIRNIEILLIRDSPLWKKFSPLIMFLQVDTEYCRPSVKSILESVAKDLTKL